MPAPPIRTALTRASLELETVCVAFHVVSSERACAAVLSALSLVAMSLIEVWRAATCCLRRSSLAFACRSRLISWSTIDDVSTPDASPERPPMDMESDPAHPARHHVERLGRRDGADDVPVEIADLDDHAPGLLVHLEVELTLLVPQLFRAGGRAIDL